MSNSKPWPSKKMAPGDILVDDMWAIHKSKQDMDMMRKAIEEMARMGFGREPIFTSEEIVQARKAALDHIRKLQEEVDKYDRLIQFVDKLPFKEGDAAFHKDHGNVLVAGVALNETTENSTYSVITKKGNRYSVKVEELMPISEATKVLFGKK
jgi:hypothetical protein